jgi:aspartate/methionine/tyrosine aminotransferase
MTGHAGQRFGWALVKDRAVAERMLIYLYGEMLWYTADTQYKFLQLFQHITDNDGALFSFIREKMTSRWDDVLQVLENQPEPKRFTLQGNSGGFYLWLECNWPEDENCQQVFLSGGIRANPGFRYGQSSRFVRINMVLYQHVHEIFLQYLQELASASPNARSLRTFSPQTEFHSEAFEAL